MSSHVGQQLGQYQLVRLLGQGGFAEVYLGEHVMLRTQAAIKVLHTQLMQDEVEDFLKEARTVAHLIHPHIVRIFDFNVQQNIPFLVMDYAPNGTLRQRHPKGIPLPLAAIVDYVKQVADALQYAHDQKVIHRDIKPENMLIGRRNEILLSDFGIALIARSTRLQTMQGVVGTAHYMAPEQFQGKPRYASDQYSLGIVVYEWLTGSYPFNGTFTEIASQHMFASPPSLREKVPQIPPTIEQVVMTALNKDPQQRFATISAFARAFEQACRSAYFSSPFATILSPPVQAFPQQGLMTASPYDRMNPQSFTPPIATFPGQLSAQPYAVTPQNLPTQLSSPITPLPGYFAGTAQPLNMPVSSGGFQATKKDISRRAAIGGLVAVAALAVAGSGTAWVILSQEPAKETSPKAVIGSTLSVYRRHNTFVYVVGWSPDGKRIASGALDKTVQIWNATTAANTLTYKGNKYAVYALAWSPDSTRIVSGGADDTTQEWYANDGRQILTYTEYKDSVNALSWSPDNKYIASASSDHSVLVWNASAKSLLFTYNHANSVRTVAWSPNGRYIAAGGDDKIVQVRDASSGSLIYTYRGHSGAVWAVAWSPDSKRIVSASEDYTVQVWNAIDGGNVISYKGHSNSVTTVDWWSSYIASGSLDRTVQIWDAFTGIHIYTYTQHSDIVTALRWSPTGTYVASASGDKTVRVWRAAPTQPIS